MTRLIVLPGGGYAEHAAHEGEPIVNWLKGLGFEASVFRYPLRVRHPVPLRALQAEIRRLRQDGVTRVGLVGFSAGGHLAGMAALTSEAGSYEPRRLCGARLLNHLHGDRDVPTRTRDPPRR